MTSPLHFQQPEASPSPYTSRPAPALPRSRRRVQRSYSEESAQSALSNDSSGDQSIQITDELKPLPQNNGSHHLRPALPPRNGGLPRQSTAFDFGASFVGFGVGLNRRGMFAASLPPAVAAPLVKHEHTQDLASIDNYIDRDAQPFLRKRQRHIHAKMNALDMKEIRLGKLLGDGDFSKTYEISRFRFSRQNKGLIDNTRYYADMEIHDVPITQILCGVSNTILEGRDAAKPFVLKMVNMEKIAAERTTANTMANGLRSNVMSATSNQSNQSTYFNATNSSSEELSSKELSSKSFQPPNDEASMELTAATATATAAPTPKIIAPQQQGPYEIAARKLITECLYMAHLDQHPNILKFRAMFLGNKEALEVEDPEAIFLITDRLDETLELRMKVWKQLRQKRVKMAPELHERFVLNSMEMDLTKAKLDMHRLHKLTQQRKYQSAVDNEIYPEDLVALQTNYTLQIAQALRHCHEHGIVLRDLRPNTIGFRAPPHHHTVQLFNFGFCKEMPPEEDWLQPEQIKACPDAANNPQSLRFSTCSNSSDGTHDKLDNSSDNLATQFNTFRNSMSMRMTVSTQQQQPSETSFFRRNLSNPSTKSMRGDAKHYRAPETYPIVRPPIPQWKKSRNLKQMDDSNRSQVDLDMEEDDMYEFMYNGYNTKADIYSLSLIYYEMLAEGKPFGRSIIAREGHYFKVQSRGLRPTLNKYTFPRTIKMLLERAWDPVVSQRYTAQQVCETLAVILHMLEGNGLPNKTEAAAMAEASATPEYVAALPNRARALEPKRAKQKTIWSAVWKNGAEETPKLDSDGIMDRMLEMRLSHGKKNKNAKPIKRSKSLTHYIAPVLKKRGMVDSPANLKSAQSLLGDSFLVREKKKDKKKEKKERQKYGTP